MELPRVANPLFSVSLAVITLIAFAEAAEDPTSVAEVPTWSMLDINRNGEIGAEELAPYTWLSRRLDGIDADRDGKISVCRIHPLARVGNRAALMGRLPCGNGWTRSAEVLPPNFRILRIRFHPRSSAPAASRGRDARARRVSHSPC